MLNRTHFFICKNEKKTPTVCTQSNGIINVNKLLLSHRDATAIKTYRRQNINFFFSNNFHSLLQHAHSCIFNESRLLYRYLLYSSRSHRIYRLMCCSLDKKV